MYPSWPDRKFDVDTILVLPDTRRVRVSFGGVVEGDTNATTVYEKTVVMSWVDSGEELTREELMDEIEDGSDTIYDYLIERALAEG